MTYSRSRIILFLSLFLLPLVVLPLAAGEKPNVLWIFIEDMSPYIGCYGSEENKGATPNIDALAESGVMFTRAYVPHPICSPCRSAMMTGAYATTYGFHNHRSKGGSLDRLGITTVPQLFRKHGYETFNAGPKSDYNFGKPRMDEMYSHSVKDAKTIRVKQPWRKDVVAWRGIEDRPFFGQIQFWGGKVNAWGPKSGGTPPANFKPCDPDSVTPPAYFPNNEVFRKYHACHCTTVRVTDEDTKTIVDQLKADGLLDKTVIFWFSDHGNPDNVRAKQFCTEAGTHVPLIVTGPHKKLVPGTVRNELVSMLDVCATSLALVGIPIPDYFDGRDLLADDFAPREYVISARDKCDDTWDRIRAVRTDRYRYIRNFMTDRILFQRQYRYGREYSKFLLKGHAEGTLPAITEEIFFGPRPAEELYEIGEDPDEINNLAEDPKYKDELERHRKILDDWINETDDKGQYTSVGYGDVSCYGATTFETPNIDRLSAGGVRFTSGYCTASTCTPTRYSFLTGTYAISKLPRARRSVFALASGK